MPAIGSDGATPRRKFPKGERRQGSGVSGQNYKYTSSDGTTTTGKTATRDHYDSSQGKFVDGQPATKTVSKPKKNLPAKQGRTPSKTADGKGKAGPKVYQGSEKVRRAEYARKADAYAGAVAGGTNKFSGAAIANAKKPTLAEIKYAQDANAYKTAQERNSRDSNEKSDLQQAAIRLLTGK